MQLQIERIYEFNKDETKEKGYWKSVEEKSVDELNTYFKCHDWMNDGRESG